MTAVKIVYDTDCYDRSKNYRPWPANGGEHTHNGVRLRLSGRREWTSHELEQVNDLLVNRTEQVDDLLV